MAWEITVYQIYSIPVPAPCISPRLYITPIHYKQTSLKHQTVAPSQKWPRPRPAARLPMPCLPKMARPRSRRVAPRSVSFVVLNPPSRSVNASRPAAARRCPRPKPWKRNSAVSGNPTPPRMPLVCLISHPPRNSRPLEVKNVIPSLPRAPSASSPIGNCAPHRVYELAH